MLKSLIVLPLLFTWQAVQPGKNPEMAFPGGDGSLSFFVY